MRACSLAFFGSCLIVFVIGRVIAWKFFALDGVGQSVFALGGVFSNNVMLGLPLAKVALGDAALPSVALVLVFNCVDPVDAGHGFGGVGAPRPVSPYAVSPRRRAPC